MNFGYQIVYVYMFSVPNVICFGLNSGHGSFSDSRTLNSVVGHILHSAILVPYNGWWVPHKLLCFNPYIK